MGRILKTNFLISVSRDCEIKFPISEIAQTTHIGWDLKWFIAVQNKFYNKERYIPGVKAHNKTNKQKLIKGSKNFHWNIKIKFSFRSVHLFSILNKIRYTEYLNKSIKVVDGKIILMPVLKSLYGMPAL